MTDSQAGLPLPAPCLHRPSSVHEKEEPIVVTEGHHCLFCSWGWPGNAPGRSTLRSAAQPRAAGQQEPSAGVGGLQTWVYSGCSKAALLSPLGQVTSWQMKGTRCARCSLERKKKCLLPFLRFLRTNSQRGFTSLFPSHLKSPALAV